MLPLTYRFLQFIEAENDSHHKGPEFQQLRTFNLLPLKRGIGIPPIETKNGLVWDDVVNEWWYKLFKIAKFESENRKFAGEILTDGKAVSIVLRKPKRHVLDKQSEKDSKTYNFGKVWGLDPGRRDLFVATNNFGQTTSCSSREFYEDAKYTSSNKTTHYWIDHNPKILEAIHNMTSPKTCSLQTLETYAKPFRKLKFRRYIFMKKKLRELCQKQTARAGRNTLVGFRDWSATDYGGLIKKCPAGLVKRFGKELKHYCIVDSIPEFRTKLTFQLALRKCKDDVVRRVKIYSVLHCRHNSCFGMTVNRDQNASKNILLLTLPH
ncbi:Hypothetical protein PHPALM_8591 [Phytophthora palmivora]|uniref:Uncharacterized protein n=1 Tax=Phytophthora palmivora TaxID=4796 RepID=A0A2P4Y9H0_9STRA|nr:Hypothetical protein PHPALM_8591 [Phytophthora palmivora]